MVAKGCETAHAVSMGNISALNSKVDFNAAILRISVVFAFSWSSNFKSCKAQFRASSIRLCIMLAGQGITITK